MLLHIHTLFFFSYTFFIKQFYFICTTCAPRYYKLIWRQVHELATSYNPKGIFFLSKEKYSFSLSKSDMPAHVVGVCVYSQKHFCVGEPIVQLCALDSVLVFWQTLRNFKFMTAILSHLEGVRRQDLQRYNSHIHFGVVQTIVSEDEGRVRLVKYSQCGDSFFHFLVW